MKANEAPERVYIQPSTIEQLPHQNIVYTKPLADNSIEYIRKDAFIKKAANYLNYILDDRVEVKEPEEIIPSLLTRGELIEGFKKYMNKK